MVERSPLAPHQGRKNKSVMVQCNARLRTTNENAQLMIQLILMKLHIKFINPAILMKWVSSTWIDVLHLVTTMQSVLLVGQTGLALVLETWSPTTGTHNDPLGPLSNRVKPRWTMVRGTSASRLDEKVFQIWDPLLTRSRAVSALLAMEPHLIFFLLLIGADTIRLWN